MDGSEQQTLPQSAKKLPWGTAAFLALLGIVVGSVGASSMEDAHTEWGWLLSLTFFLGGFAMSAVVVLLWLAPHRDHGTNNQKAAAWLGGFLWVGLLSIVTLAQFASTDWDAGGSSPAAANVDCDEYRTLTLVPALDKAALPVVDEMAAAEDHFDDYRYEEAKADYERMGTAAEQGPSKFRKAFGDAPCQWDRKGGFMDAAADFFEAARDVANAGAACMAEYDERPEDAWKSTPCRRYNAELDAFTVRATDYGDERDRWVS